MPKLARRTLSRLPARRERPPYVGTEFSTSLLTSFLSFFLSFFLLLSLTKLFLQNKEILDLWFSNNCHSFLITATLLPYCCLVWAYITLALRHRVSLCLIFEATRFSPLTRQEAVLTQGPRSPKGPVLVPRGGQEIQRGTWLELWGIGVAFGAVLIFAEGLTEEPPSDHARTIP